MVGDLFLFSISISLYFFLLWEEPSGCLLGSKDSGVGFVRISILLALQVRAFGGMVIR